MKSRFGHLTFSSPAMYQIRVLGKVKSDYSDRLGGLSINAREEEKNKWVTTLSGEIRDQAELTGIIHTIYEMHLPLLSVYMMEPV